MVRYLEFILVLHKHKLQQYTSLLLKNKAGVPITNEMLRELIIDMDLQGASCSSIEEVIKAIIKI